MREVKFRAWVDFKDGKSTPHMTEVFGLKDFDDDYFIPSGISIRDEDMTVMQFTGLKDKNGEEIYEGDIIQWEGFKDPHPILWRDAHFYLGPNLTLLKDFIDEMEIIGNIYENPDLLK